MALGGNKVEFIAAISMRRDVVANATRGLTVWNASTGQRNQFSSYQLNIKSHVTTMPVNTDNAVRKLVHVCDGSLCDKKSVDRERSHRRNTQADEDQ